MKRLVVLGGGTAGTIVANRVQARLPRGWAITVVDPAAEHVYQPGLTLVPFGDVDDEALRRPRERTLARGVEWRRCEVRSIEPARRELELDGGPLAWDLLVIASGARPRLDLTPGFEGAPGRAAAFEFYTLDGAGRLRDQLSFFNDGRLIVNVAEAAGKSPIAALELLFLADAHFRARGARHRVELMLATPLDGALGWPLAADAFARLMQEKGIGLAAQFTAAEVDRERRVLRAVDGRALDYELLVSIPKHSGAAFVERSGLGDERGFVPTDRHTLRVFGLDDAWALGDATNLPSPKAGSVAHLQAELLAQALLQQMRGREPAESFDGHADLFVDTGQREAVLLALDGELEAPPGNYPFAGFGPFTLLRPSRLNHWGKDAMRKLYFKTVLPGGRMPLPRRSRRSAGAARPPTT